MTDTTTGHSGDEARSAARFGAWAALGTGVVTLVTFGIAIATPPISGELCQENCVDYPYLDIAARFPSDYYWMFLAMLATLFYVAFMLALSARAAPARRLVAQLAVALSVMAATFIVGDYFLQLAVIQPSVLSGEADGISLLTQNNPHGVFIALEELGYLLMSQSLACMAAALTGATRLERATRWCFVGGWIVSCVGLAWILLQYGHQRGTLFELVVISADWLVLVGGALLMVPVFRRDAAATTPEPRPS